MKQMEVKLLALVINKTISDSPFTTGTKIVALFQVVAALMVTMKKPGTSIESVSADMHKILDLLIKESFSAYEAIK